MWQVVHRSLELLAIRSNGEFVSLCGLWQLAHCTLSPADVGSVNSFSPALSMLSAVLNAVAIRVHRCHQSVIGDHELVDGVNFDADDQWPQLACERRGHDSNQKLAIG